MLNRRSISSAVRDVLLGAQEPLTAEEILQALEYINQPLHLDKHQLRGKLFRSIRAGVPFKIIRDEIAWEGDEAHGTS